MERFPIFHCVHLRSTSVSDRDVDLISTDAKDLKVSAWISHCSQTNVESRGRKGVGGLQRWERQSEVKDGI